MAEAGRVRTASSAAEMDELLVIDATAFDHDDHQGPEKSWCQLHTVTLSEISVAG